MARAVVVAVALGCVACKPKSAPLVDASPPAPPPEKLEDCPRPAATHVIGFDSNDVWALVSCRDEKWQFPRHRAQLLLHTAPAGDVYDWPAP